METKERSDTIMSTAANKYLVIPLYDRPFLTSDAPTVQDYLLTEEAYVIDMDKREEIVSWDANNGWIEYTRIPFK